ncbi:hypothetical protein GT037_000373, partial [Alternaria burnsii]
SICRSSTTQKNPDLVIRSVQASQLEEGQKLRADATHQFPIAMLLLAESSEKKEKAYVQYTPKKPSR